MCVFAMFKKSIEALFLLHQKIRRAANLFGDRNTRFRALRQ